MILNRFLSGVAIVLLPHTILLAVTFNDGFECADAPLGDPPPGGYCQPALTYCEQAAQDPLMQPEGRSIVVRSWNQSFFAAPFYTPTTYLHPIGSNTMGNLPQPFRALAIEFTPQPGGRYRWDWAEAQTIINTQAGIRQNGRPAHDVYITISPCPGDFRLENNQATDPYLKRGCRRSGEKNQITFGAHVAQSTTTNCRTEPGGKHYVNVGFFHPGELDPQAHTCVVGVHCEINVQPQ